MMRQTVFLVFVALASIFPIGTGYAAEDIEIASFVFPPGSYKDDNGELAGKTVETVRAILVEMGYNPVFVEMPFKRCLETMKDGSMPLILPCIANPEREEYIKFAGNVASIFTVLWKNKNSGVECWNDYPDLAGKVVGVSQGYAYGTEWDEAVASGIFEVEVVSGENPELKHFRKLSAQRTDYIICEKNLGEFIQERNAPEYDEVEACPRGVGPERFFRFGVSIKYFEEHGMDADAFVAKFNEELAKVQ